MKSVRSYVTRIGSNFCFKDQISDNEQIRRFGQFSPPHDKKKSHVWGFFGTAACRPIVPLPPMSSPHSSPDAPRTTQARGTSASEGGNYTRNFASTFVIHGGTVFFYMPQSWDTGQILSLPLRRKACGGFFRCPKNPTTSTGFEPANSGARGHHPNH